MAHAETMGTAWSDDTKELRAEADRVLFAAPQCSVVIHFGNGSR